MTFNTHEAVKALKGSGFNEKQAESVVETINKAVNETVATKSDLALLGAELGGVKKTVGDIQEDINENMATKADLALLKKTVEAESANLETRMMRMLLIQTLVLVGMLIPVIGMLIPLVAKLL